MHSLGSLFISGVALLTYGLFIDKAVHPELIVVAGGLTGLPAMLASLPEEQEKGNIVEGEAVLSRVVEKPKPEPVVYVKPTYDRNTDLRIVAKIDDTPPEVYDDLKALAKMGYQVGNTCNELPRTVEHSGPDPRYASAERVGFSRFIEAKIEGAAP